MQQPWLRARTGLLKLLYHQARGFRNARGFESRLVNKHECTINPNDETKRVLESIEDSKRLLDKAKHRKAQEMLRESLEKMDDTAAPVKWVALNACGVALHLGGQYQEAERFLRLALAEVEALASRGMSQDAFVDLAGCMGDLAVNSIKVGHADQAITITKRALFMTARAYRRDESVVQGLQVILSYATMEHDPIAAKNLAVKITPAISALAEEKVVCARSLGVLAEVMIGSSDELEGIKLANTSRSALNEMCGPTSVDFAAASMTLARGHFLLGKRSACLLQFFSLVTIDHFVQAVP